jgi:osomolarity two-component system sensor histidine kinase SLN1
MRISIRRQLAFLLLFDALIGLAALAVATWVINHDFVLKVR